MKRVIMAAEESEKDTRFDDGYSALKDDFNYLLDGLEKLDRETATLEALEIMDEVSIAINDAIANVANSMPSNRGMEE